MEAQENEMRAKMKVGEAESEILMALRGASSTSKSDEVEKDPRAYGACTPRRHPP